MQFNKIFKIILLPWDRFLNQLREKIKNNFKVINLLLYYDTIYFNKFINIYLIFLFNL